MQSNGFYLLFGGFSESDSASRSDAMRRLLLAFGKTPPYLPRQPALGPPTISHSTSFSFLVRDYRLDRMEKVMNRDDALRKSEEALDELVRALEQGKSEVLVGYLAMLARFHRYSFGNCILIAFQKPDATLVAGFQRWKAMGRFVKRGEHGIAILAPIVRRGVRAEAESDEEKEGEDPKLRAIRGFRVAYVFDVSQTEGKDLPTLTTVSGEPGEKLARLEAIVRGKGIELRYETISSGALGISEGGKITVNPTLTPAESFSVLVHELAHELLHRGDRRKETTKRIRETEAEAVAFVVCRASGLECSTKSSDYVQLWGGDKDLLLKSLELIRHVSSGILAELGEQPLMDVHEAA